MMKLSYISRSALAGFVLGLFAAQAQAEKFNFRGGALAAAPMAFTAQSGISLVISNDAVKGVMTHGASGDFSPSDALVRLLKGTGFVASKDATGVVAIVREGRSSNASSISTADRIAAVPTSPTSGALLETVTVTSSKIGGDVQNIPISITALSQEQLTQTQTAGGPDLVKQVPNLTFTKTNFTGYSITIRGIGTQAISVTTDPAVAVALNDMPFIRNHFFEQEFYDLSQAEVLRGPQGTLYGRNATAGVVNLVTAKPSDQFEAMASLEIGNYGERRPEGMVNIPIIDDRLDLRVAGEWTKRQGYSFNDLTDSRIDGRDLWSARVTLAWNPTPNLKTTLLWEHFSEDDDRMRTSKQLCKTAPTPTSVAGVSVEGHYVEAAAYDPAYYLSQGCEATSLYSPDAYQLPNGLALPYASALGAVDPFIRQLFDPYTSTTQSQNLHVIESTINPSYRAKNDTLELDADYSLSPALTFTSQTGFNNDFLWSTEDYNRFNTATGFFSYYPSFVPLGWQANSVSPDPSGIGHCFSDAGLGGDAGGCTGLPLGAKCTPSSPSDDQCQRDAVFCDPQLGCANRLVAQDLSDEHSWQLSQEFRLTSNFNGPLNFSVGGNFLHYETEENYYVFINSLTSAAANGLGGGPEGNAALQAQWVPGVSDNSQCLPNGFANVNPLASHDPTSGGCAYIDPNPLTKLNNEGHNYFLSQNPYVLNSYAGFGEVYYNVLSDLKLTGGVRWTDDEKHFTDIPSELLINGYGYPVTGVVNQKWNQWTGRAAINWSPKLSFTDQTLIYGSYAHGYKAGGANPPGATLLVFDTSNSDSETANPIHPLTFKPEFIDAFELGSKNTLLDGALTLNGDVFFYKYKDYQISEIVDRTSINLNFNAKVKGAELEAAWEPIPGLRFNFAGGWEDTRIDNGQSSIDLIDRTDAANHPGWMVVKPFVTQASNCILPTYVVQAVLFGPESATVCAYAYADDLDPVTRASYMANPTPGTFPTLDGHGNVNGYVEIPVGYSGFDPTTAPNNGEGFAKNLGGNKLPNAPPFTVSFGTQYTLPITTDWAGTLRGDYYWQDYSWARVFNDDPYDRLRGYTNVNLTLIFTNQNGWQVM